MSIISSNNIDIKRVSIKGLHAYAQMIPDLIESHQVWLDIVGRVNGKNIARYDATVIKHNKGVSKYSATLEAYIPMHIPILIPTDYIMNHQTEDIKRVLFETVAELAHDEGVSDIYGTYEFLSKIDPIKDHI